MYEKIITTLDAYVWAEPLIALILLSSIYFTIRFRFVQLRDLKHQIGLLFKTNDNDEGIKPMDAFFTIVAYRVGTANIAGVAVAVLFGGPGAVVWMVICSLLNAAISYAECALGQVYKVSQDGEFRGGSYYYLERGLGMKKLGKFFALLTLICVPVLTVGPHANSISLAFKTSMGAPQWITCAAASLLLLWVVFGGIKRIGKVSTILVPIMTSIYLLLTLAVIIMNIKALPALLVTMFSSALGVHAVFGALIGQAVMWGVKRSVNSSGAGMGEAVPGAAAANVTHPGESGLTNSLSVFIDVTVCFSTGIIILISDCFNIIGANEEYLHLGQGSEILAEQALTNSAGIPWTQAAANTVVPGGGAIIISICLFFFAFTTVLNYYYQGETAVAYLFNKSTLKVRKTIITVLRVAVPLAFFSFSIGSSTATWAVGSFGVGLMVWTNVVVLLVMSPTIVKVYQDYQAQRKAGVEEPVFNPEKLGIKNAEIWMRLNKDKIEKSESEK